MKKRISDLEIAVPGSPFDYRITVSLETSISDPPPKESLKPIQVRKKDRMTYIHGGVQVDLTQVKTLDSAGRESEPTHELEIEMRDMDFFVQSLSSGSSTSSSVGETSFEDRIEEFVNTLRSLNRRAAKA